MKLLKDLLYTRGNEALDISRLSVALSVLAFWGGVFWHQYQTKEFDPAQVGLGIASVFAGGAGFIHFRQKHEEATNGVA